MPAALIVPVIAPVEELMLSPVGSAPDASAHEEALQPVAISVIGLDWLTVNGPSVIGLIKQVTGGSVALGLSIAVD